MNDDSQDVDSGLNSSVSGEMKKQLREILEKLPSEIEIFLFIKDNENDVYGRLAKEILQAIEGISSKIRLNVKGLDHRLARKWKIDRSPVILFSPDKYSIKWFGAPAGEEGRTLLETILLIGFGKSYLSNQSVKIMNGVEQQRFIKIFVSPTCPYCPQQAVNGVKAAIEKPEIVSLEIIDIQCNPDLADRYSASGVPLTFANEILIAKGAQSEELFVSSLEKLEEQTVFIPDSDAELVEVDLLIIGAGPAGLTAGIYASRSGLKTVLVERGVLGGQVSTTPVVENYPGFTQVGGKTLVDIMVSHVLQYVQIFKGEEVVEIKTGERIEILSSKRRFLAKAVLFATGATHRSLDVPGESRMSGRGVSYCATCDGPLFKGKEVAVIGGGDSAVTEALYLYNMGVSVTLIHRRGTLRAQEFLARNLFENKINIMWDTDVMEILGDSKVTGLVLKNNTTGRTDNFKVDGIFVSVGYIPEVALAKKVGLKLTEDGYIKHDSRHRTNIKGLYSAGDVEGGYKQIVTAAGQGAEAAMTIFEDIINPYWKRKKSR